MHCAQQLCRGIKLTLLYNLRHYHGTQIDKEFPDIALELKPPGHTIFK